MIRSTPVLLLTILAPVLAAAGTAASTDQANRGDLIHEGGYEFRYFGRDLGDESFRITETTTGYRIEATLELDLKGQVPSHGLYELDEDRRLVRATYRELVPGGAHAEYIVEEGVLIARGLGGSAQGEHRIELDADTIVTGPHYVTDFFVLQPLALDIGESHEQGAFTFGFDGWEPTPVTLKSKRTSDKRSTDMHGTGAETTVYRCDIITPEKTYKTRSYLDDDGVSVRIKVGAPVGWMNVIRE